MWKDGNATEDRVGATMATYLQSVEEFSRHATELLQQVPTMSKARDAYQKAMAISADLRNILDAGDEALNALYIQLEQHMGTSFAKPSLEKKKSEPARVEPIKTGSEPIELVRA